MENSKQAAAKIIRKVRVLKTGNPAVAVLELSTANGADHFAVTREAMVDIANHLLKNADKYESGNAAGPEGEA